MELWNKTRLKEWRLFPVVLWPRLNYSYFILYPVVVVVVLRESSQSVSRWMDGCCVNGPTLIKCSLKCPPPHVNWLHSNRITCTFSSLLQKSTISTGTSTQSAPATPHHLLGHNKDDIYIDDDALEGSGGHGRVSRIQFGELNGHMSTVCGTLCQRRLNFSSSFMS